MLQSLIPSPQKWLAAAALCVAPLLAHSAAGGLSLTTRQRHLRPPLGGVLIASATVADEDWPDLAAALEPSITSFRLAGEGDR